MNPSDDADEASKNDPSNFVSTPELEEGDSGTTSVDPAEDAIAAAWRPPDHPPADRSAD